MNESTLPEPVEAPAAAIPIEPPGGWLVWIVIVVELLTFGAALVTFLVSRHDEPAVFAAGRASLNQALALANTIVLLTGGWLMANAVATLKRGLGAQAERWMHAAAASGGVFMVLKGIEWAAKLRHGLGLHHDTFFTYYWLLTGFHFLHVAVAVVILLALARGVRRGRYGKADHFDVESGAAFWHMCDLVWLSLYPTIYLLGGGA